ncbi:endonuclease V isoform X2 [Momordica charantia]|uniref:Endonuclease V isoform X2 n=1 Tax=Momordica charantia TaxID=3673 RepID=A0A6J1BPK7_MOMCH|nr:endonuclease V isoform X2 [Momordica charantia]
MSEEEKQETPYSEASTRSSVETQNWIEAQDLLKKKLIKEDEFTWKITEAEGEGNELKFVGGVDISFLKEDSSVACGTLVVLDLKTLQLVYDDFSLVTVQVPYVPGFLAFREAPVLLELLERMKKRAIHLYPQLLMVDGNGILHPRGFGLASHLGVLANLPTIGIGKNLHHVDGLTQSSVRQIIQSKGKDTDSIITLRGVSGCIWGVAMRSTVDSSKPIYVSIGHRVSLDTAIKIVKITCKHRVPEPIRQADIRSREYLRKFQMGMLERATS